ncbi:hypothetical protein [Methylomonas sp. MgM2]
MLRDFEHSSDYVSLIGPTALRPGSSPRFDTIAKVCRALGVKLHAEPV